MLKYLAIYKKKMYINFKLLLFLYITNRKIKYNSVKLGICIKSAFYLSLTNYYNVFKF